MFIETIAIIENKGSNYTWKQTLEDVQVSIPVEPGTRGKDVNVKFETKHLKVESKGKVLIDVNN